MRHKLITLLFAITVTLLCIRDNSKTSAFNGIYEYSKPINFTVKNVFSIAKNEYFILSVDGNKVFCLSIDYYGSSNEYVINLGDYQYVSSVASCGKIYIACNTDYDDVAESRAAVFALDIASGEQSSYVLNHTDFYGNNPIAVYNDVFYYISSFERSTVNAYDTKSSQYGSLPLKREILQSVWVHNDRLYALSDSGVSIINTSLFESTSSINILTSSAVMISEDMLINSDGSLYKIYNNSAEYITALSSCNSIFLLDNLVIYTAQNEVRAFDLYTYHTYCVYKTDRNIEGFAQSESSSCVVASAQNETNVIIIDNEHMISQIENEKLALENSSSEHTSQVDSEVTNLQDDSSKSHSDETSDAHKNGDITSSSSISRIESACFHIDYRSKRIYVYNGETTVSGFKSGFNIGSSQIELYSSEKSERTSGKTGSSFTAHFVIDDKAQDYIVVIIGDVTGEGSINTRDYRAFVNHLLNKEIIDDDILRDAADINRSGDITAADWLLFLQQYQ